MGGGDWIKGYTRRGHATYSFMLLFLKIYFQGHGHVAHREPRESNRETRIVFRLCACVGTRRACVYVCMYMCVCVCVCIHENEQKEIRSGLGQKWSSLSTSEREETISTRSFVTSTNRKTERHIRENSIS